MSWFAPLPDGFPKFDKMLSTRDAVKVIAPPPVLALGERLRSLYAVSRETGYQQLGSGDLRKLPYAYFIDGLPPLAEVEPELAIRYWAFELPQALLTGPSRVKRWLRPLYFAYCERFDAADPAFQRFADQLRNELARASGAFAGELRRLQAESAFFDPAQAPKRLAAQFIDRRLPIDDWLEGNLLWPEFTNGAMGQAVFRAILAVDGVKLVDAHAVDAVLGWCSRMPVPVVKTSHRVELATALLRPWIGRPVSDAIKAKLSRFFIDAYGDPRLRGHRLVQWDGVPEEVVRVLLRWLAGETLRGFMKILERTADETWRYRQRFWMAYYDADHVEEAWLVLGRSAMWMARQMLGRQSAAGLAELEGNADPNQSVLLLRIGDLIFTEWSHNGSLRAYRDGTNGPQLYAPHYSAAELRAMVSLDFHQGVNERPQLVHANSANGTWQRKARDFVRRRTGIRMHDREILL